jgi:polyphosphate glucokinase
MREDARSTDGNEKILAVDIGGSGLKAAIVDRSGRMLTDRVRVPTPARATPRAVLRKLAELVRRLDLDASVIGVSVGFPGVVRDGRVLTAPNLGNGWPGFALARALAKLWKKPVRVVNDADMQGLGAASGRGVEVAITLGTGFGSALLVDGELMLHLEIAHIPFRNGETYDEQLGQAARKTVGKKRWNRRVRRAIDALRVLTHFDRLYIGGGNSRHVTIQLPADVRLVSNEFGMKGGAALWRDPGAKRRRRGRDSTPGGRPASEP